MKDKNRWSSLAWALASLLAIIVLALVFFTGYRVSKNVSAERKRRLEAEQEQLKNKELLRLKAEKEALKRELEREQQRKVLEQQLTKINRYIGKLQLLLDANTRLRRRSLRGFRSLLILIVVIANYLFVQFSFLEFQYPKDLTVLAAANSLFALGVIYVLFVIHGNRRKLSDLLEEAIRGVVFRRMHVSKENLEKRRSYWQNESEVAEGKLKAL